MTRRNLIKSLVCLYAGFLTIFGLWTSNAWKNSQPLSNFSVKGAALDNSLTENKPETNNLSPYPVFPGNPKVQIYAKQFLLYEPQSGKVLWQSGSLESVPIASTTKLMTTRLASKLLKPDDIITVSSEAANQIGSLMGIANQEKISVESLLYGSLLVSGNDAVYALAEQAGGILLNKPQADSKTKVERFVKEMNNEASALNLKNTRYMDPAGLNDEGHSNALDLAKLVSLNNEDPLLKKIMTTAEISVTDQRGIYRHDLRNSNRLVADYFYDGVGGGKTGYTPDAGHCLVGSATRNGHTLIAVILHTLEDSNEASAVETRKLLDAGFNLVNWE